LIQGVQAYCFEGGALQAFNCSRGCDKSCGKVVSKLRLGLEPRRDFVGAFGCVSYVFAAAWCGSQYSWYVILWNPNCQFHQQI
jgi:hypothetical protein